MARHIRLRIDPNPQILRILDDISDVLWRVVLERVIIFLTDLRQLTICWPEKREALSIVNVPVEDVEVVLVQEVQEVDDGLHGEELSARVEHEASVEIEIVHAGRITGPANSWGSSTQRRSSVLRKKPLFL